MRGAPQGGKRWSACSASACDRASSPRRCWRAGRSGTDGVRALILPHAIALSDAEVAAIREFAAGGGKVLADTEPGLFDGHSRRRASAPLAGVASVPEAMLRTGMAPGAGTLEGEAGLLAAAGVVPRAVFRAPDGSRAPGLEVRWFRHGDTELLSLQALAPYAAPREITVELPDPMTVSDLRRGGAARQGKRFTVPLDAAEPTILSLTR